MIKIYWLGCWFFYYIGVFASKMLRLFNFSDIWIYFWFNLYNTVMLWSRHLQGKAGFNPYEVDDVSTWVWHRVNENDIGDDKCQ